MAASRSRGLRLAGALADGVILGGITEPMVIAACKEHLRVGAEEAGRSVDDLEIAITPSVFVTDHEPMLDDMRPVLGPKSLAPASNFSYIAERTEGVPADVVADLVATRQAYDSAAAVSETQDPDSHLRTFSNYMTELKPGQAQLVTKNVLDSTAIYGTPEQALAKIRALEEVGIERIILSPVPDYVDATIDICASSVIPRVDMSSEQ